MTPNRKEFCDRILERFIEGDSEVDMMDIQNWAVETNLLKEVDGGFDPENHIDLHGFAEKGDQWFEAV